MVTEDALQSTVVAERARVLGLEARLAGRRAAEAAELELLASQQQAVAQQTGAGARRLEQARAQLGVLAQRQRTLEQGLSRAHRSWLRLGEPVLAGLLLFFCLTVIGAAIHQHAQTAGLEVAGFFLGLLLALARRRQAVRT